MEEKLVILTIFQSVHKAYISRDRLLLEGIQAWVTDENTIINNPFYTSSVGGAKLWVTEKNIEKATLILDSIEASMNN